MSDTHEPIQYLAYRPTAPDARASVTAILDGIPYTLTDASPVYEDALDLLRDSEATVDDLMPLFAPVTIIGERLTQLSENITTDGTWIFYDGDALDEGVARHILRVFARVGKSEPGAYLPTVRFLEKLYQNPTLGARDSLYQFLRRFDFTLTPDGDFIAYKGVSSEFRSIHAGPGVVDGQRMHGHLPNHPGSVLTVARSYVNDDPARGCSTGLHAGTYAYARSFARGGLVTVEINPRDVVSVPDDANWQKIRVCRYRVLEAVEHEYESDVYGDDDNF